MSRKSLSQSSLYSFDLSLKMAPASSGKGAYVEYAITESECAIVPTPESWSFEQGAQFGIAPFTALQCLHETLELRHSTHVRDPNALSSMGRRNIRRAVRGPVR